MQRLCILIEEIQRQIYISFMLGLNFTIHCLDSRQSSETMANEVAEYTAIMEIDTCSKLLSFFSEYKVLALTICSDC